MMRPCQLAFVAAALVGAGGLTPATAKGGGPPRMALSADGNTAVASDRWFLRVYRISETAQVVRELHVVQYLSAVAVRGSRVAAAGTHSVTQDNQVLLLGGFDDPAPETILSLDEPITDLQFSPGGDRLAIASADGWVRIWDVSRGGIALEIPYPEGVYAVVYAMQFSPDGELLATAGTAGVNLWQTATGERLSNPVRSSRASSLAFDPSGSRLLVGNSLERDAVILVDWQTGDILAAFDHVVAPSQAGLFGAYATAVAFGPDGRVFGSAALDGTVRVWDAQSLALIATREFSPGIYSLAFDPSGEAVLSYGTSEAGPALDVWRFAPASTAVGTVGWADVKRQRP